MLVRPDINCEGFPAFVMRKYSTRNACNCAGSVNCAKVDMNVGFEYSDISVDIEAGSRRGVGVVLALVDGMSAE